MNDKLNLQSIANGFTPLANEAQMLLNQPA